jgi:DNA-binding transcriptional ArsR family regulator
MPVHCVGGKAGPAESGDAQVITLELDADDVAAARFTISPLHETVASLVSMYLCPVMSQARWARDVQRRPEIDHQLLRSLVSPVGWMPDFLTPAPLRARPQLDEQLAQVRATPAETVIADIHAVYTARELPAPLRRVDHDPIGLRNAIAETLAQHWEIVLAPHWPRMRAILEADLLYRGLQCAALGAGAAFDQLAPQVCWTGSALRVDMIQQWNKVVPASGQVLQFIPSVFSETPTIQIDTASAPLLGYRSRRAGLMWQEVTPVASSAIRSLLGRRRASVLAVLDEPRSTTEIAHLLSVTPSAVSQHLAVLSASRLVERARVGRVVLYSQSALAHQLLQGNAWAEVDRLDQLGDLTA